MNDPGTPPSAAGAPDLPPSLAERRAHLDSVLRHAAAAHSYEDGAIREAVETYARAAREAGRAPEWLVVDLKRLVHEEALSGVGDWFRGIVADRAVSWGIASYFAVDGD